MTNTSLNLGKHWDDFIEAQVNSGRYATANDVVRDALEGLKERERKLAELRREIEIGLEQARRGELAEDDFLEKLLAEDIADATR
ncbi:MAG: type II toxin-antitoxin system ParD family antitoxin [Arenimonas sp.]|nr:type II toxin-antitoxin system ParD family antitoxin [Rhizobium sp.]MBW8446814.1 type II toxin-antitoxin system ParD family antitoxin [Arenimonas sp.]